ncbi:MAG: family 20 glycosylhydrolase [Chryseolinea sp.]
MENILRFVVIGFVLVLFQSCASKDDFSSGDKISLHWEILTNFTDQKDVFNGRFIITNNSKFILSDKNWALFFNMAPRPILDNNEAQPALVKHINGDWYKLVPESGFDLPPGKSVTIDYRGTEAVIKETDRPLAPYFAFYDNHQAETNLTEVLDYTWSPFTTKDQINRTTQDEEPIPTAAWKYKNNLELKELPTPIANIHPAPYKINIKNGFTSITDEFEIVYPPELKNESKYLASSLKDLTGKIFKTSEKSTKGKLITLALGKIKVNQSVHEAYRLDVNGNGVVITGSDPAGVFYGIQSLRSLIPLSSFQKKNSSFDIPQLTIEDAPRFQFRGLQLDVSRNFQTKETILQLLDLMSFYKLNRFLFYTTEDEGFRLEIKDLPELTEVGAQRQHTYGKEAPVLHPGYGSGPFAKQEGKYGHGYYSHDDFIEILKYAKDRHIKVIPELNFPGHARAAIKAMEARYETLMQRGNDDDAKEYRLIDPDDKSEYLSAQGYTDNVVAVSLESTYHFYEKVVSEITAMYTEAGLTLDEFHSGGDEVPEGAWTKSPLALALMKEHPEVRDPHNLQTYFFRELLKRLKTRNLQIDGWEEVFMVKAPDGNYQPNEEFVGQRVVPFIWNNLFDHPDLGYRLANAGYDVVLCNVSNFYFDLAYNKDPEEPGLYWAGFVDTRNAWTFAPYDMYKTTQKNSMGQNLDLEGTHNGKDISKGIVVERLKREAQKHILGVEAQVWSETIKGQDMMEYYVLPKLIGFAESAWTKERVWETIENKSQRMPVILQGWNAFANDLAKKELPRMSYLNGGYNYRIPPPGAILDHGELKANVEYPGLIIRYTTDGTEPTDKSIVYNGAVKVKGIVRIRSFDVSGRSSKVIEIKTE